MTIWSVNIEADSLTEISVCDIRYYGAAFCGVVYTDNSTPQCSLYRLMYNIMFLTQTAIPYDVPDIDRCNLKCSLYNPLCAAMFPLCTQLYPSASLLQHVLPRDVRYTSRYTLRHSILKVMCLPESVAAPYDSWPARVSSRHHWSATSRWQLEHHQK